MPLIYWSYPKPKYLMPASYAYLRNQIPIQQNNNDIQTRARWRFSKTSFIRMFTMQANKLETAYTMDRRQPPLRRKIEKKIKKNNPHPNPNRTSTSLSMGLCYVRSDCNVTSWIIEWWFQFGGEWYYIEQTNNWRRILFNWFRYRRRVIVATDRWNQF